MQDALLDAGRAGAGGTWRQLTELYPPPAASLLGHTALPQRRRLCGVPTHSHYHHYTHSTHSSRHKLETNTGRTCLPPTRSGAAPLRQGILGTFIYLLFLSGPLFRVKNVQSFKSSDVAVYWRESRWVTPFWIRNASGWLHKRHRDTCFLWLARLLLSLAIGCNVISYMNAFSLIYSFMLHAS